MILQDVFHYYHLAAALGHMYLAADRRTYGLDIITCRRVRLGDCSRRAEDWRKCGARAARVTMDRGFAAAEARLDAQRRMLFDPDEERQRRERSEAIARWERQAN